MRPTAEFDPSAGQRNPVRILLLEDDPTSAGLVRDYLNAVGWTESQLEWVSTLDEALTRLAPGGFDLVLADLGLPDSPGGLATLDALKRATDRVIVVISGNSEPGTAHCRNMRSERRRYNEVARGGCGRLRGGIRPHISIRQILARGRNSRNGAEPEA